MAVEDTAEWSANYGPDGIRWSAELLMNLGVPAVAEEVVESYVMSWRTAPAGGPVLESADGSTNAQGDGEATLLDGAGIVRNIANFLGLSR